MPTILYIQGWRFHFFSNEGNELEEAFEHNVTPRLRREVRQIIFTHFENLASAWREDFGGPHAK